jgi:hypothetical protein
MKYRFSRMAADPTDYSLREAAESELALLGALLNDSAVAWPQVKDIVMGSHFARPDHRMIFDAIVRSIDEHGSSDVALVIDALGTSVEAAGGRDYILGIYRDYPTAANAAAFAKVVRKFAGRGKVVDLAAEIEARARMSGAADAADYASKELARLAREYGDAAPRIERRPLRWTDLETKTPPTRSWHISHWLTAGPTLLAGVGGVGKTLIAQTIGTALALGRPFLDEIRAPSTVLMWACEDDHDELWRRQVDICAHFGVPLSAIEGKFIVEPRLGRENTLYDLAYGSAKWTPLRAELASQVADYGAKVLFLDNIGQLYGAKENDRHHVTAFLNGLAGISPDLAVVIMGHPAKTTESEFSGSTAWENGVRMRWYMGYRLPDQPAEEGAEPEEPTVRYLAKRKANYSDKDFRKLEFSGGLFVPENSHPRPMFAMSYAERLEATSQCVLRALQKITDAGIRVTDGRTSPDYLPRKMRDMKLHQDYSAKELADALGHLRLAGKVTEGVVGKYANRGPKTGLVVAP